MNSRDLGCISCFPHRTLPNVLVPFNPELPVKIPLHAIGFIARVAKRVPGL